MHAGGMSDGAFTDAIKHVLLHSNGPMSALDIRRRLWPNEDDVRNFKTRVRGLCYLQPVSDIVADAAQAFAAGSIYSLPCTDSNYYYMLIMTRSIYIIWLLIAHCKLTLWTPGMHKGRTIDKAFVGQFVLQINLLFMCNHGLAPY